MITCGTGTAVPYMASTRFSSFIPVASTSASQVSSPSRTSVACTEASPCTMEASGSSSARRSQSAPSRSMIFTLILSRRSICARYRLMRPPPTISTLRARRGIMSRWRSIFVRSCGAAVT